MNFSIACCLLHSVLNSYILTGLFKHLCLYKYCFASKHTKFIKRAGLGTILLNNIALSEIFRLVFSIIYSDSQKDHTFCQNFFFTIYLFSYCYYRCQVKKIFLPHPNGLAFCPVEYFLLSITSCFCRCRVCGRVTGCTGWGPSLEELSPVLSKGSKVRFRSRSFKWINRLKVMLIKLLLIVCLCFLVLFFLADTYTFSILGPLVSIFWISGGISSGFQSGSEFCLIRYCRGECKVHSDRSTCGATSFPIVKHGSILHLDLCQIHNQWEWQDSMKSAHRR